MMRFLSFLQNMFGKQKKKLEPYSELHDDENITRYLFHRKQFTRDPPPGKSRVKYAAFSIGGDGKASVYRTDNLTALEILNIGRKHVASVARKPIRAWATLKAGTILRSGLAVELDGTPHPRHANISEWPGEQAKIKMLQLQLAKHAELCLPE